MASHGVLSLRPLRSLRLKHQSRLGAFSVERGNAFYTIYTARICVGPRSGCFRSGAETGAAKSDKNGGTALGTIVKRSFVQAGKNQHGDSKIVECRSGFAMAEWCRSEK